MADVIHSPDGRVSEILESVRGVFAQRGFDGASMQDLARGAGMSAGNFYRYFSSKDAIIEAMVAQDLARVQAEFAAIMESPDPREAFRRVIRDRVRSIAVDSDGPLWAEIEAASSRRAEIAEISHRMHETVILHVSRVLARIAGLPDADAHRFAPHATLVFMLVKGVAIHGCGHSVRVAQGSPSGSASPEVEALVLRTIDHVISDVVASAAAQTRSSMS